MEMRGGRPAFLNLGEERVVSHGTIKLIRVRQGEVCRVWEGSRPLILSPSDEVYVRNDVSFRLASEAVDGYGKSATTAECCAPCRGSDSAVALQALSAARVIYSALLHPSRCSLSPQSLTHAHRSTASRTASTTW